MGKPGDEHDSTMDISVSQLVPDAPKKKRPPPPSIPANDASYFKQIVVGTDDFAPPALPKRSPWLAIGAVLAVLAIAGAGIAIYASSADDQSASSTENTLAGSAPAKVPAPPADEPNHAKPPDAPAPAALPDAAVVAAPPDAATPAPDPAAVDAVSGVAPVVKPKPVAKRPVKRAVKRPVRKVVKKPAKKKPLPKKKK